MSNSKNRLTDCLPTCYFVIYIPLKVINTGCVSHRSSSWLYNVVFLPNMLSIEMKPFFRVCFWKKINLCFFFCSIPFRDTLYQHICDMSHKQQIRTNPLTITDTHSSDSCFYDTLKLTHIIKLISIARLLFL